MRKYIFKFKGLLFTTVFIRSFGALMQVFVALVLRKIIDTAMARELSAFYKVSLFAFIYFLIMALIHYLTGTTEALYLKKTITALREDVFTGVMKKNPSNFNSQDSATYISNLTNDINLVENNFIIPYLMVIGDIIIFVTTIFVLLYINPKITLILFLTGILMLLIPMFFSKPLNKKQAFLSDCLTTFTSKIKDIFSGYEIIKCYDIEKETSNDFSNKNFSLSKAKFHTQHYQSITDAISLFLSLTCQVAGLVAGGYFLIKGSLSVGSLIAILNLGYGTANPIMWIVQKATKIKGMTSVNKKLLEIINENEAIDSRPPLTSFKEKIILNNLNFSYNSGTHILNNVNFTFEKNKKYALVGESGSGKTTLIKVLLGYHSSYTGSITIDNLEIKDLNPTSIIKNISVIPQNVYLFNKTIEENISLSKEFSSKEFSIALNTSGVQSFLPLMSNGIKTSVGENGSNLSGGQKQRVAIARALIRNTSFLILDEGTSALDLKTSSDIDKTLLEQKNLTILTITHKLDKSLLSQYDSIIFMKDGMITEQGSFTELLKKKGDFFTLYSSNQIHRKIYAEG